MALSPHSIHSNPPMTVTPSGVGTFVFPTKRPLAWQDTLRSDDQRPMSAGGLT